MAFDSWENLPDGRLIAYKALTPNPYMKRKPPIEYLKSLDLEVNEAYIKALTSKGYVDKYSQTVPQDIGDVIEGKLFYAGSLVRALQYADPYTDDVVRVAIWPSDIISLTGDTLTTCRYEILELWQGTQCETNLEEF